MELTRSLVERNAREYAELEPLATVEAEHVELLPGTFESGEFGRRDAQWVVQWYFRRFLGAYPDKERRATEEAFRDNEFTTVRDALTTVRSSGGTAEKLDRLTTLDGVDVPVASAFLLFIFPSRYVVLGEREWTVLHAAGELDAPYPEVPSIDDYQTYDARCRELRERFDVDAWTLYRALWRLGADRED
ncbi:hypothetical protein [Halobaculum gomorrense]|uniref:Uncharacterized protein n=1 Tax=Halobaculum gomorrense TaxID=43928 RepID=A0A1M5PDP0_9EURY|nr:hypothetical protein [Halobaculum gomorrense]SHG99890.1 hypothetical protein SAMN05443636_1560 [Halobaculum gomorrense]